VSLSDHAIKIRETVVSVSPEPVVIVTKSLIDIIPVPGIYRITFYASTVTSYIFIFIHSLLSREHSYKLPHTRFD
jgi:hypothetical protein